MLSGERIQVRIPADSHYNTTLLFMDVVNSLGVQGSTERFLSRGAQPCAPTGWDGSPHS